MSKTSNKSAASQTVTADVKLSLSVENRDKLRQMIDDFVNGKPDIPKGMLDATATFRGDIDGLLVPVMTLANSKAISNNDAFTAFNKLRGALHGCSVKGGVGLSDQEREALAIKQAYRKHAQDFADAGLAAFSEPKRHTSSTDSRNLSGEILDKADEVRLPGNGGGFAFAGYLGAKLANQNTPWNSLALVTALYNLNELDPIWPTRSGSPALCELIVQRLHTIANKETFDGRAIANLARIAPGLIDAVGRLEPKSPQLEKMLINSLSKAIEYADDKPSEQFADGAFLYPMRRISSRFLTTEGASALCAYVAKLNHLFSQMSYSDNLSTIAATFHAMNGISSWALTPDSNTKLTVMLNNLNGRLAKSVDRMEPIAAASIIYGLKGLDIPNLSPDAQEAIVTTIRLVSKGIERMTPGVALSHTSVSSIIHGLTIALSVAEGPVAGATRKLLDNVMQRLPRNAKAIDQIGGFTGALVTLHPYREEYAPLCQELFREIAVASQERTLTYGQRSGDNTRDDNDRGDHIAWQTIQQAYALFDTPIPRQLADFLRAFQKTVEGARHPNISEQRIEMYLKRYPGVTFLTKPFIDGFETDHMIQVGRTIVNVEVDGSFHNDPEKRIADGKRDEHLRKKMATVNFKILRVPSTCSREELFTRLDALLEHRA